MTNRLIIDVGTVNFCYCLLDENDKILDLKLLDLTKIDACLCTSIITLFNSLEFTHIYVEIQMANQTKMIILQNIIKTYALLKDKQFTLLRPKQKTKLINPDKIKSSHAKNKKLSVEFCSKNYPEEFDLFIKNQPKKDDLSDVLIYSKNLDFCKQ